MEIKAFPGHPDPTVAAGMDLRDWFAGMALASMPAWIDGHDRKAQAAFAVADAMMKAREQGGDG